MHAGHRDSAALERTSATMTKVLAAVPKLRQAGLAAVPPSEQHTDAASGGVPTTEGTDVAGMMPGNTMHPVSIAEHDENPQTVNQCKTPPSSWTSSDKSAEVCGVLPPGDCGEEGRPGAADSVQALRLRKGVWRKRGGRAKGAAGAESQAAAAAMDGTHSAAAGPRVSGAGAAYAPVAKGVHRAHTCAGTRG